MAVVDLRNHDRATQRKAKLILYVRLQRNAGRIRKEVVRIQHVISKKLLGVAIDLISA